MEQRGCNISAQAASWNVILVFFPLTIRPSGALVRAPPKIAGVGAPIYSDGTTFRPFLVASMPQFSVGSTPQPYKSTVGCLSAKISCACRTQICRSFDTKLSRFLSFSSQLLSSKLQDKIPVNRPHSGCYSICLGCVL